MKYCRFLLEDAPRFGLIEGGAITRVLAMPEAGGSEDRLPQPLPLEQAKLLAPVQPSKIICVGRNYREHASELGNEVPAEPLLFFKPPSSVIAHGDAIVRPPQSLTQRVDFEGELGVVIGKLCRKLGAEEDVRGYIRGYTCVNDVTARDLQKKDGQWTRAKGFDTFCPVGPIVTGEGDPWGGLEVETRVNGSPRQRGNTRDFIFSLDAIIRYVSQVMTLLPGDLISTGTPSGVGPLQAGDLVEVSVEGVGTLRNPVE